MLHAQEIRDEPAFPISWSTEQSAREVWPLPDSKAPGPGRHGDCLPRSGHPPEPPGRLEGLPLADSPRAMERFRREAQAAAALRHPNLCPVYDCDVHDGVPYFTMAFIEGPTLDEWVAKRGGVTLKE